VTPFIITARDGAGVPVLLWPFGMTAHGPVRVLSFLGGKYANLNFGLWQRDFAAAAGRAEIASVVEQIGRQRPRIDLLALHRQPRRWQGLANPLALLPHQPSPEDSRRLDLHTSPAGQVGSQLRGVLRKQLRSKDRRLAALPGYRYRQAETAADIDRLLDWFFAVKAQHLAAQGAANVFAEPGVADFLRAACRDGVTSGSPVVELHALECDREVLALLGGIGDGTRFSSIFNTYTLNTEARHSPGLVLLMRVLDNLTARHYGRFDLGVGDARYKRMFCRTPEPLFDSFLPLTPPGRVAAVALRSGQRLKRGVKQHPALLSLLQRLRGYL
jgi:CelD/BcsL family acetyltransferase involved in cellulose biosynthesis